jgi:hypothetical protein
LSTCFWGRRKDEASVEAPVREELHNFGCGYL